MAYTCAQCNGYIVGNIFRCADLNTCSYNCSFKILKRIKEIDPSLIEPSNWGSINKINDDEENSGELGMDINNISISLHSKKQDINIYDTEIYNKKINKIKFFERVIGYFILFISTIRYNYACVN